MNLVNDKARHYIYGIYIVALVFLLGIAYLAYRAIKSNEENVGWVIHTQQVLTESERLYSEVKDAQRAQRGFLLTEDSLYLQKYSDSEGEVFTIIKSLKSLTADQALQQKRLDSLTVLVHEAFDYWDKTIFLNQNGDRPGALSLVKQGVGRELAGRIGRLIGDFKQFGQGLLAQRQAEYISSRHNRNAIVLVGGVLALLLLSLAFLVLRRLLERERQLTFSLEDRVQERTADLNNSLQELKKSNEELDSFIYTASHDLRTPVLNLQGLQQVLQRSFNGSATPKQQQYLARMEASVSRLNKTITELADVAKISRENLPPENLQFQAVLQEVITDIRPLIDSTKARISTDFQIDQLRYPYAHLQTVLYNLLSNAVKFHAPDRRPMVKVVSFLNEQERICLQVEDNGLGLAPEQLEKIFTIYKRFHTHVEGSGVGLHMIRRIVENGGGQIQVSSELGKGCCFRVVF